MQLKCRVWTAIGVKKKVVSEGMVCVCVKLDVVSATTMPKHNSTNLEAETSCPYMRPKTET